MVLREPVLGDKFKVKCTECNICFKCSPNEQCLLCKNCVEKEKLRIKEKDVRVQ